MLNYDEILYAWAESELVVDPDDGIRDRLQPASLDVRLGATFAVFRRDRAQVIDPKKDSKELLDYRTVKDGEHFVLHPGEFVLAHTLERVGMPADLVARVEGKSSLGRLGLLVHSTAGFIDPGFDGQVTLELACVNSIPILLYPGMPIGQLSFDRTRPVRVGYSGKYVGQSGPTPSRYHQNWNGAGWG
jgi:dCTP deaminase